MSDDVPSPGRTVPDLPVRDEHAGPPPPVRSREQERSLWLHRAVAVKVRADPESVLERAARNLERMEGVHHGAVARQWVRLWREVLDEGATRVLDVLTGTTAYDVEMRQNSPFAGVLPDQERRQVLEDFVGYWTAHQAETS